MTDRLAKRINKKVSYRFCGRDLYFYLSMGLFSSFDIDTGTKLLLRALAEKIDFSKVHTLLDTGCGTGVIAVSLKKTYSHVTIDALDRDSLALEITAENARLNKTEISVFSGLDILEVQTHLSDTYAQNSDKPAGQLITGKRYDLITTNIPAKAGLPVLRRFFHNGLASLSDDGCFAAVIVEPLRETAENLIAELGAKIVFQDHTSKHSVFFIQYGHVCESGSKKEVEPVIHDTTFPGPYLRMDNLSFSGKNISYAIITVFDLPGFDTIPIPSAAAADLYTKLNPNQNSFLFWNPGQGHSAVMVLKNRFSRSKADVKTCQCVLAGRDILALLISRLNIQHEFPEISCRIIAVAGIDYLPEKMNKTDIIAFDFIGIEPDIIPGYSFADSINENIPGMLSPVGKILVSGKSSDIGRITTTTPLLTVTHSKKTKGFRAVVFSHKIQG
ncbi:MAG: methyltransferase [Bacteroidetes bacterium]|nr:methyltransferase [Bacteroidota bacterium]